ncbi:hypothetical protein [Roseovarius sp. D22-M7]|uniref:hypothetical protein n=1 Tax=Roseovarius sp. D22-M7 TaxID=3127116 RepID=UPI00300F8B3E
MAVNNRGRCYVSGPGSALTTYHRGLGREHAKLFANCGSDVLPTRAAYLYYERNHYSFLHHDAASAHITLITGLSEKLSPLLLFPNFGRASQADIDELNQIPNEPLDGFCRIMMEVFGDRGLSIQVPVTFGVTLALPGRAIAHARTAQSHHGAIATTCYSFITPPEDFLL